MAAGNNATRGQGLGVDNTGGPVVDPTANVVALVEANAKSTAMLRDADIKFNDATTAHLKEIGALRSEHVKEARSFDREQSRAIREVDQANAKATAEQILQAVNTNAAVAERTAQTLAKQVTDTAAAAENRQVAFANDMGKRLSAVELSMSKGEGKQQVSDPAMERLAAVVEKVALQQQMGSGKSEGVDATWKLIIAVGGLLLAFLAYQTRATSTPAAVAPQVILMPSPVIAPPTTTTTTTIPAPR